MTSRVNTGGFTPARRASRAGRHGVGKVCPQVFDRLHQRGGTAPLVAGGGDIPRKAGQARDAAGAVAQREFSGQAPAGLAVGYRCSSQFAHHGGAGGQHVPVLLGITERELAGKQIGHGAPKQLGLAAAAAAIDQSLVDREVAAVPVLQKENGVGHQIEQFTGEQGSGDLGQLLGGDGGHPSIEWDKNIV